MKRNPRAGQGEKKDGTKAENGNGCSINNGINRKQKPGNAAQDRRGETRVLAHLESVLEQGV